MKNSFAQWISFIEIYLEWGQNAIEILYFIIAYFFIEDFLQQMFIFSVSSSSGWLIDFILRQNRTQVPLHSQITHLSQVGCN